MGIVKKQKNDVNIPDNVSGNFCSSYTSVNNKKTDGTLFKGVHKSGCLYCGAEIVYPDVINLILPRPLI